MNITLMTETSAVVQVVLDNTSFLSALQAKITELLGVPLNTQLLRLNGVQLDTSNPEHTTLSELGISDGALIMITRGYPIHLRENKYISEENNEKNNDNSDEELQAALQLSMSQNDCMESESEEDEEAALAAAISLSHKVSSEHSKDTRHSFKELHASLVASGMDPNVAAAAALRQLQAESGIASEVTPKKIRKVANASPSMKISPSIPNKDRNNINPKQPKRPRHSNDIYSKESSFVRADEVLSVAQKRLDTINSLYKTDGVVFIDDQFPPIDKSLYTSTLSATTWKCRACQSRNQLPNHSHLTTEKRAQYVFELMRNPGVSMLTCSVCMTKCSEIEVALRPTHWLNPAFIADDITFQKSTVPWVVFRGEPRPDDIRQGGVGNCWFVCALSALAEKPEYIRRVVITDEFNPAGAYQIRLCRSGTWCTVTVDHSLPVGALGTTCYLKPARRSLWGPLIEKAAAKIWGSYEALAGGTFAEAFAMLTGYPVQTIRMIQFTQPSAPPSNASEKECQNYQQQLEIWKNKHTSTQDAYDQLFARVYSYKESGFVIGASTYDFSEIDMIKYSSQHEIAMLARGLGLQIPHAYAVLDVVSLDPDPTVDEGGEDAEVQQLVKLRNPNGRAGWKGPWSYNAHGHGSGFYSQDKRWTIARQRQLSVDKDDEGVFWMAWSDFCKYFAELTVCRLLEDYQEARMPGWLASSFGPGQCLAIDVFGHTRVEISGTQEAHSQRGENSFATLIDLGLCVVKCPSASVRVAESLVQPNQIKNPHGTLVSFGKRCMSGEGAHCCAVLEHDDYPSTRYLVLPLCFGHMHSQDPRKFMISVHSPVALTIETIPATVELLAHATISAAIKYGKKEKVLTMGSNGDAILMMYILQGPAGYIVVAENLSPFFYCRVEVEAGKETVGYTSSRVAKFCQDVVPPRSRQLVMVISANSAVKQRSLGLGYNASALLPGRSVIPSPEQRHMPPLEGLLELRELHAPQMITDANIPIPSMGVSNNEVDAGKLADSLLSMLRQNNTKSPTDSTSTTANKEEITTADHTNTTNEENNTTTIDTSSDEYKAKISRIVELGFPRSQVESVLATCNGNEAVAINILLK